MVVVGHTESKDRRIQSITLHRTKVFRFLFYPFSVFESFLLESSYNLSIQTHVSILPSILSSIIFHLPFPNLIPQCFLSPSRTSKNQPKLFRYLFLSSRLFWAINSLSPQVNESFPEKNYLSYSLLVKNIFSFSVPLSLVTPSSQTDKNS